MHLILQSVLFVSLGWWISHKLVLLPNLQIFKFLEVIGIICNLAGAAILSRLVIRNEKLQRFIVGQFSNYTSAFFCAVPLGFIAFSFFGHGGQSKPQVDSLVRSGFIVFFFATSPIYIDQVMRESAQKLGLSLEVRANLLGGFFIFGGLLIQLIAALIDLSH